MKWEPRWTSVLGARAWRQGPQGKLLQIRDPQQLRLAPVGLLRLAQEEYDRQYPSPDERLEVFSVVEVIALLADHVERLKAERRDSEEQVDDAASSLFLLSRQLRDPDTTATAFARAALAERLNRMAERLEGADA